MKVRTQKTEPTRARNSILALTLAVGLAFFAVDAQAASVTVTFDEAFIAEGQLLDTEYNSAAFGFLSITVDNVNRAGAGEDFGVAFDSQNPTGGDTDLQTPATGGGNLPNTLLKHVLIIQEHGTDSSGNGIFGPEDNGWVAGNGDTGPDDEGDRPAGIITLNFGTDLVGTFGFGFDLLDVEGADEFNSGFAATFFNGNNFIQQINFSALIGLDPTIAWGDNSLNRIDPSLLSSAQNFDRVDISLGGSAAIDNLVFMPVPEPATLTLLLGGLGVLGVGTLRRRFRG